MLTKHRGEFSSDKSHMVKAKVAMSTKRLALGQILDLANPSPRSIVTWLHNLLRVGCQRVFFAFSLINELMDVYSITNCCKCA